MPEEPVRLAAVSYLNTRPLIEPIESGQIPGYKVVTDLPSRLPALVESGDADLGLLPAGYCVRHPELALAPGAGIACRGPVRSILLLLNREIGDCRRVAVTSASMSSVALLRLLLEHHFRRGKNAVELIVSDKPDAMVSAGEADGALLIGDPALQAEPGQWRSYDLGEEWFRFCGLPFVFAVWAGPDAEIAARAAPDLVRAMELGRAEIPRLAAEAAGPLGIPAGLCEDYLTHFIVHDVGEAEMQGYRLFQSLLTKT